MFKHRLGSRREGQGARELVGARNNLGQKTGTHQAHQKAALPHLNDFLGAKKWNLTLRFFSKNITEESC